MSDKDKRNPKEATDLFVKVIKASVAGNPAPKPKLENLEKVLEKFWRGIDTIEKKNKAFFKDNPKLSPLNEIVILTPIGKGTMLGFEEDYAEQLPEKIKGEIQSHFKACFNK